MVFDDCAEVSAVFETWCETIETGFDIGWWMVCKIGCIIGSNMGFEGGWKLDWEMGCKTGCEIGSCALNVLKTMPLLFAKPPS